MDPNTITFLSDSERNRVEKSITSFFKHNTTTEKKKNSTKEKNSLADLAEACGVTIDNTKKKNKKLTIREEIDHYKTTCTKSKLKFEEYWHSKASFLSLLASLVRKYCAIPASSVASESAFSIANFIQRKERSALSEDTLRSSMLLRQKDMIKKISIDS